MNILFQCFVTKLTKAIGVSAGIAVGALIAAGQGLAPTTPAKEYIYFGGEVVVVEAAGSVGAATVKTAASATKAAVTTKPLGAPETRPKPISAPVALFDPRSTVRPGK